MDDSQSAGVLVCDATASAQSGPEPARCQPTRRRTSFFLLNSFHIGGTEVQAVKLASRLNPEHYDMTVAMLPGRCCFQIVHTHDLYANVPCIPAAAIARVPVITSRQRDLGHSDFYKSKRRLRLRRLQKLSTAALTNANAVRDAVLAEHCFAPEKVRVVHNDVDRERSGQRSQDRAWLSPGAGHEKWIVLVGNMHREVKGHAVTEKTDQMYTELLHSRGAK